MSVVDYSQTAEDHQSLLILVRHTGSHLPTSCFSRVWERINRLAVVHVQGQNRNVVVRYKRGYAAPNNEWGDFQAHRKVLGLICVGKCVDHEEFGDLFENYKKVKEEYASTIINSRLIIYGMNTDGSPLDPAQRQQQEASVSPPPSSQHSPCHSRGNSDSGHGTSSETSSSDSVPDSAVGGSEKDANNSKEDSSSALVPEESDVSASGGGKGDSVSPRRERSGSDECSVTITGLGGGSKRRPGDDGSGTGEVKKGGKEGGGKPKGRPHSNSLTKESTGSEVVFYPSLDQCDDLEDRLKEFVTSLFFVLEGKRLERTFERSDRLMLLCAPFEKKDYIGVDTDTKSFKRKCMGRLRKHLGDLCLQAGLPGEAILHYQTALDLLRTVNDFLWMGACYEGLCSASVVLTMAHSKPSAPLRRNQSFSVKRGISSPDLKHKSNTGSQLRRDSTVTSFSNGVDHLEQATALHCLNPDDIIEKYKEAITHYSKYKNSAMVEMEASMKACRVLIYQRKYLQASDFLQNVVYINLASSEEDKIQRYSTLSALYGQIGFHRKEAFFKRVAAMQCVSPGSNYSWYQCYHLLLQAVEGYNIALDPRETVKGQNNGWPVIQHRVLHELVYSARRMGNPQLAVRHSTLLLHTMYSHLSPEEQREAVTGLETLTSRCQGTPQPLSTESGVILPPVHLTTLPTVRSIKVLSPPSHLRPVKMTSPDDSPGTMFLYTPLSLANPERKSNSPNVSFEWVAEDQCEVQLQVVNPLSVELNMLNVGLLTEGLKTEVYPANPSIPPQSPPIAVTLTAKPLTPGNLKVIGYGSQVFGVRSHCRLRDMHGEWPPYYNIEVVPALPQLTLTSSLPKAMTFAPSTSPDGAGIVLNSAIVLYAGQSQDSVITLQNVSSHPVSSLSLTLDARGDSKECTDRMFQWSRDNIQSQLPLQPGAQLCVALCLYAHSDFLLPPDTPPAVASSTSSSQSNADSSDKGTQTVEGVLSVEYTGGPGLEAGYCRRCSMAISVDVNPSLHITHWDAKSTNSNHLVTIVLDLQNGSAHPVDVQCLSSTPDPSPPVTVQPQQTQRIEVTIARVIFPEQEKGEQAGSRIPSKYRAWKTPDFHSQFLSSFIDLQWTMPGANVKGKIAVDYLKWTDQQLELIKRPDIVWEVLVNQQQYTAPDLMDFPASAPVTVDVTLSATNKSYHDVTLTVQPSQERVEGQGESGQGLDSDFFVCLGSQAVSIPQLGPECRLQHRCSFLFLYTGHFRLDIFCTARLDDDSPLTLMRWSCLPVPQFYISE